MLLLSMLSLATLIIVGSVGQIAVCLYGYIDPVFCPGVMLSGMIFGVLGLICIPAAISIHFEVKNRERRADPEEAP